MNTMIESLSWKVTLPLRMLARILRGDWGAIKAGLIKRSPFMARMFNPAGGGFPARMRRGFRILMRQGPSGLSRKPEASGPELLVAETPSDYQKWLEHYNAKEECEAAKIMAKLPQMKQPLISVVMPTYNTDEKFLRLCIDSVLNQSYQNWELCIADDASTLPHVKKVLKQYKKQDKRIKIVLRKKNGHISAASNSALDITAGEFVALLDHDDELPMHALLQVVNSINENPAANIFYGDEDKMDANGIRFSPHFKPDWNPDLLYSNNYVSHLGVYNSRILKSISGFRIGLEGSQDYDLLLRCLPHISDGEIIHVPKILYHWRAIEGSTALQSSEKDYTTKAGLKALEDYFGSLDVDVSVRIGKVPNTYDVKYALPAEDPLVSLLIPTRDHIELIRPCVESILEKTTYKNYEIIILDNQSKEPAVVSWLAEIQKESKVRVLRYEHPFNYSAINNFGVNHANGNIIGLINNDIKVISPGWLTEMVMHVSRPDVGCVGAKLYYGNDTIQHAGVIMGVGGVAGHSHLGFPRDSHGYFARLSLAHSITAVTAACLLVRKDVFNGVGGLNEQDLAIAFNDVDLCLKVKLAGYRNIWTPYAELYHYESISRGSEDTPEKQARFSKEVDYMLKTWPANIDYDSAYSPWLTKERADFSLVDTASFM